MKKKFSTIPFQQKIEKPWGYELLLTRPESPVTGKILHLNSGARFSLQFHDVKEENLTLITGEALIILEDENGNLQEIKMEKQKGYNIKPFQKHRMKGITECDIYEASTREEGNTVRLEDDYSRGTETEAQRQTRDKDGVYTG